MEDQWRSPINGDERALLEDIRVRFGVEIENVSHNVFVFHFKSAEDRRLVMAESPWTFDRALIVLVVPTGMYAIENLRFTHSDYRVQIHHVPLLCMTKEIGHFLGGMIGSILDVKVRDEGNARESSFESSECLEQSLEIDSERKEELPYEAWLQVSTLEERVRWKVQRVGFVGPLIGRGRVHSSVSSKNIMADVFLFKSQGADLSSLNEGVGKAGGPDDTNQAITRPNLKGNEKVLLMVLEARNCEQILLIAQRKVLNVVRFQNRVLLMVLEYRRSGLHRRPDLMKTLAWNAHGLGSSRAVYVLQRLKREIDPEVIFFMETKMGVKGIEALRIKLGYVALEGILRESRPCPTMSCLEFTSKVTRNLEALMGTGTSFGQCSAGYMGDNQKDGSSIGCFIGKGKGILKAEVINSKVEE
ncbi:hypothetical protein Dsin_008449 [Dipteronia sinensis]|uniref:DUF4283 domain-containing protein n=1 Tax=Dipteronia sinensis TaxID=43782 RepID=A0AAE0EAY2_9ROSI|nr:hypothetical protein Dsin_008449 [Dipteronia sinensis]